MGDPLLFTLLAPTMNSSCCAAGEPGTSCVIVIPDIFGNQSARVQLVCDHFASKGFFVMSADHFRGQPWALEKYPPESMDEFGLWFGTEGAPERVQRDFHDVLVPKARAAGALDIVVYGFCWGGM